MEYLSGLTYDKTGGGYPMVMVLRVTGCSSANWYEKHEQSQGETRGRKPSVCDQALLAAIREVIAESLFHGEGYIKVWKKLAKKKHIHVSNRRVNRLMRENNLLSPYRHTCEVKKKEHKGRIIQEHPNLLWGTDGKKFFVESIGWCWFFAVIDHFNDEIIAWHICKRGTRWAALEPVKAAVKKVFHSIDKEVCKGTSLKLRSDHGTQYDSDDFMKEMVYLGLDMSKAYVRSPECNGCIERFNRTIEEEVFSIEQFSSLEQAQRIIETFIGNYNREWMIHRLKYMSPQEYRAEYERKKAA